MVVVAVVVVVMVVVVAVSLRARILGNVQKFIPRLRFFFFFFYSGDQLAHTNFTLYPRLVHSGSAS